MRTPLARERAWHRWRVYLVPAIIFLAVTLPHLEYGDFRVDTGLYAAVGLQAWRTGELWTLHAGDQPYFNKPPLPFWIHGLVLHWAGPTILAARLPTIVAALGSLLTTIAIARVMAGTRTALAAGVVLALTSEMFRHVRAISLDIWQLLFMLLAVLLAAVAVKRGRWSLLALAGAPLGLALLCKPFMAMLVPPILALWLVWNGQTRRLPWIAAMIGVAIAVAAPWHLSMLALHGDAFADQYLGREVIQRATGEHITSDGDPVWDYVLLIAETYWPWLLFFGLALVTWGRGLWLSRDDRAPRLALIWIAVWLVGLSIFPDRRPRYALPLWPMMAMLGGMWLAVWPWAWLRRWEGRLIAGLTAAVLVIGVTLALLPVPRTQAEAAGSVRAVSARVFGDPPEPQWPALFEWIRENQIEALWEGSLSMQAQSRLYLELGWWPRASVERNGTPGTPPPEGALLLYHRRGGRVPGENEAVVFEADALSVTRLGPGGWRPVKSPDPGE